MAEQATVKPTLGLTGVTVNAMALIAPGAFLWITYQLQAAATAPDGSSVASDIWAGIGLALILAFLTAVSYAQLARLYPEAGFGSCYYFAEKAFLDRENKDHHRFARISKLVTGWAASRPASRSPKGTPSPPAPGPFRCSGCRSSRRSCPPGYRGATRSPSAWWVWTAPRSRKAGPRW